MKNNFDDQISLLKISHLIENFYCTFAGSVKSVI